MFTGIIESVGHLVSTQPKGGDKRVRLDVGKLDMGDVQLGDSIAVNGVCLTVVEFGESWFAADVSNETLSVTTLGQLQAGSPVNLEKALLPTTRLGGHLVSGHVDGVGKVVDRQSDGRSERFTIEFPDALQRYIAAKGSVCVQGVSLTVNAIEANRFELNLVPHTLQETNLDAARPGVAVNLEVDVIARYLEQLITGQSHGEKGSDLSLAMIEQAGLAMPKL